MELVILPPLNPFSLSPLYSLFYSFHSTIFFFDFSSFPSALSVPTENNTTTLASHLVSSFSFQFPLYLYILCWQIMIGLAHLWLCLTTEQLSWCHGVRIVKHIQEILGQLDGKKDLQTCHPIRSSWSGLTLGNWMDWIGQIVKHVQGKKGLLGP